jgi:heptaprenyl diphosphate synthase
MMPSLSKNSKWLCEKEYIAYLGALTLLFSYAEMFLPRTLPFFRLGLGNVVMLLSFSLPFSSYMLLSVIKAFAASLMAGTLFTPFFLLSLGQSVSSAIVMYALYHLFNKDGSKKSELVSIYGISMAGASVSSVVQIALASLYLGEGTFALLGPMILFSLFAGILTAFMALHLNIPSEAPALKEKSSDANLQKKSIVVAVATAVVVASVFVLMQDDLKILGICVAASVIAQKFSGRKILFLPHFLMWLFVIFANILVPAGKVLCTVFSFSVTEGALLVGVSQAMKLSAVSALSQCVASLRPEGNSLVALTLKFFRGLSDAMRNADGNVVQKVKFALSSKYFE